MSLFKPYFSEWLVDRAFRYGWVLIAGGVLLFIAHAAGWHLVFKPTEDQRFGCTVEQQAPSGECK